MCIPQFGRNPCELFALKAKIGIVPYDRGLGALVPGLGLNLSPQCLFDIRSSSTFDLPWSYFDHQCWRPGTEGYFSHPKP